ncbi:MAG: hypothetical protein AB1568_15000 [Thermodesulfobacteriota bacterium]
MCREVRKQCQCGRQQVQFHLRDNVMIPEVISRLFCPECPGDTGFVESTMITDNGWIIEYDMELARALGVRKLQLDADEITPAVIFDGGYACWLETYPGEREEIREEKCRIMELLKVDQKKYLEAIHSWNIDRVARLKADGWRRARLS